MQINHESCIRVKSIQKLSLQDQKHKKATYLNLEQWIQKISASTNKV